MIKHERVIRNAWRASHGINDYFADGNVDIVYHTDDGDCTISVKNAGNFCEVKGSIPTTWFDEALNGVAAKLQIADYMSWYKGEWALMDCNVFLDNVEFRVIMS